MPHKQRARNIFVITLLIQELSFSNALNFWSWVSYWRLRYINSYLELSSYVFHLALIRRPVRGMYENNELLMRQVLRMRQYLHVLTYRPYIHVCKYSGEERELMMWTKRDFSNPMQSCDKKDLPFHNTGNKPFSHDDLQTQK